MERFDFKVQPIDDNTSGVRSPGARPKRLRRWLVGIVTILLVTVIGACVAFYMSLQPVNAGDSAETTVVIEPGMSPRQIAQVLKENTLIQSKISFRLYTKFQGVEDGLQAGSYHMSPAMSVREIVALLHGDEGADVLRITIIPGSTLARIQETMVEAGFARDDIQRALAAEYDVDVLTDKPQSADLEGYLFPETHEFTSGASAEDVVETFLKDMDIFIRDNNLKESFKAHKLSIFEGITLASIIEKESAGNDQRQIAQILLLRLQKNMRLDADPTYQYAADKAGVSRNVALDSPYNTRKHKGLPPGPIANPGQQALLSIANPTNETNLYFVHGDDDSIHTAKTEDAHDKNVKKYCHEKCRSM